MEHLATAPSSRRSGFTLLEMIGVLAIIGVLATLMAPNAIKAIDRAATRSEAAALGTLADGLRQYLIDNEALPSAASWTADLSPYAELSASSLAANSRSNGRVLIYDPATSPAQRAIFLSSMRSGLALPTAANINTPARFQALWDTADGAIPPTSSWASWSAWNAVANAGDYLLIERINLRSVYLDELKTSAVAINNTTAGSVSYEIQDRDGNQLANAVIGAGGSALLDNLSKGDRVLIYGDASYSSLVYSYIAEGDDKSFDLSDWIASPGNGGNGGSGGGGSGSGGSGSGSGSGSGDSSSGGGNGSNGNGNGNGKGNGGNNGNHYGQN